MFWTSFCASLERRQISKYPIHISLPPSNLTHFPSPKKHPLLNLNQELDQQNANLPSRHLRPDLPKTLTNPQDPINQQPIRRPLYLEVAEKRIRPEQTQHLV
jgi:hypothetical protein